MPDKLTLKSVIEKGVLTIHGDGRLNYASAVAFKTQLKVWLASDVTGIVFDMKGILQIDSAGIGLLAQTLNQSVARGVKFEVIHTPAALVPIFELSGLAAILKKHR